MTADWSGNWARHKAHEVTYTRLTYAFASRNSMLWYERENEGGKQEVESSYSEIYCKHWGLMQFSHCQFSTSVFNVAFSIFLPWFNLSMPYGDWRHTTAWGRSDQAMFGASFRSCSVLWRNVEQEVEDATFKIHWALSPPDLRFQSCGTSWRCTYVWSGKRSANYYWRRHCGLSVKSLPLKLVSIR